MAHTAAPGPATVLAPDPDLLPALRPLAARPAARAALLWRPHDPLAATGLLLPADLRAEVSALLEARGFTLAAEDLLLGPSMDPSTPSRGPGGAPLPLPRGVHDLYAPRRAWREAVAAHPGAPDLLHAALAAAFAEAPAREHDLLRRAAAESDLLALGDLLERTALAPGPATARLIRAIAAGLAERDAARPGDLALLLQHDHRDPGVTPLARLALGAALWQVAAPALPPDAEVEAALADLVLARPPA
ncbi:MAG: hypothetical protein KF878_30915, partial [Planctomycetes bacterium]|nr:hypothetical protein [Planctomycetota bacterium]